MLRTTPIWLGRCIPTAHSEQAPQSQSVNYTSSTLLTPRSTVLLSNIGRKDLASLQGAVNQSAAPGYSPTKIMNRWTLMQYTEDISLSIKKL
ncbi:MAG: hypothetical protein K2M25_06010 [Muribaculaceae bacterium]|nr:hypothetical protein [Muribaculaceae bacterium]